jgi:hypothetical protein
VWVRLFRQQLPLIGRDPHIIPLTLPSHSSLFTSTYPFANGIEENGERAPAGLVTLTSTLRTHGYQAAAFVGSIQLHR